MQQEGSESTFTVGRTMKVISVCVCVWTTNQDSIQTTGWSSGFEWIESDFFSLCRVSNLIFFVFFCDKKCYRNKISCIVNWSSLGFKNFNSTDFAQGINTQRRTVINRQAFSKIFFMNCWRLWNCILDTCGIHTSKGVKSCLLCPCNKGTLSFVSTLKSSRN